MKNMIVILMIFSLTSLLAKNGADIYKGCAGCHGEKAEKKAFGKSKVISGWSALDIEKALNGYKNGSYGGAFKDVVKGRITDYSFEDIKAVSTYIEGLK